MAGVDMEDVYRPFFNTHEHVDRICADLAAVEALPLVVSVEGYKHRTLGILDGHTSGDPRRWLVRVKINGPPGPYENHIYTLELSLHPAYPDFPPILRFACVLFHSQVNDMGFPNQHFYGAGNLNYSPDIGIRQIIEAAYRLLGSHLEGAPASDDDLLHGWAHHVHNLCTHAGEGLHLIPKDPVELSALLTKLASANVAAARGQYEAYAREMAMKIAVENSYQPMHPELFEAPQEHWFAPSFLAALRAGDPDSLRSILFEETPGVYSFDMVSSDFCDRFVEELHNYEQSGLPQQAPNSMNSYGCILNNIGMEHMLDKLMLDYIAPFAAILYPENGGTTLDYHHSFTVQYKVGKDMSLDMHTDDSDVTLNLCLADTFTGGDLAICGVAGTRDHRRHTTTHAHIKGRGLLHLGIQRHGALNIQSGERNNLIVWCRSSRFRSSPTYVGTTRHPNESTPSIVCVSRAHDRDASMYLGA